MAVRIPLAIRLISQRTELPSDTPTWERSGYVQLPTVSVLTGLFSEIGRSVRLLRQIDWGDGVWRTIYEVEYAQDALRRDGLPGPHESIIELYVFNETLGRPVALARHRVVLEPVGGPVTVGVRSTDRGLQRVEGEPFPERHRSIAKVQHTLVADTTSSNTRATAFATNVAAGNMITANIATFNASAHTISTPTDGLSNTYTASVAQQSVGTSVRHRSYHALNIAGGACTITYATSLTSGNYYTTVQTEWSGAATSGTLDQTNSGSGTSTAPATGSVTPTTDNQLVLASVTHDGGDTAITQTLTLLAEREGGSNDMPIGTQYEIQTTATARNPSWTFGASRTWVAHVMTFKAVALNPEIASRQIFHQPVLRPISRPKGEPTNLIAVLLPPPVETEIAVRQLANPILPRVYAKREVEPLASVALASSSKSPLLNETQPSRRLIVTAKALDTLNLAVALLPPPATETEIATRQLHYPSFHRVLPLVKTHELGLANYFLSPPQVVEIRRPVLHIALPPAVEAQPATTVRITTTRFYLPSTGAAAVSPAFGAWSLISADRIRCVTSRINSAMTNKAGPEKPDLQNDSVLARQYVSDPIVAQTISGSVKAQLRALTSDTAGSLSDCMEIHVVSNDGATVRGTLLAVSEYGPGTDMTTTLRNKTYANGDALSSVVALDGDRIVIELGAIGSGNGPPATPNLNFGDDSSTDLPEDETTLSAFNPWVEFSNKITFQEQVAPGAKASYQVVSRLALPKLRDTLVLNITATVLAVPAATPEIASYQVYKTPISKLRAALNLEPLDLIAAILPPPTVAEPEIASRQTFHPLLPRPHVRYRLEPSDLVAVLLPSGAVNPEVAVRQYPGAPRRLLYLRIQYEPSTLTIVPLTIVVILFTFPPREGSVLIDFPLGGLSSLDIPPSGGASQLDQTPSEGRAGVTFPWL